MEATALLLVELLHVLDGLVAQDVEPHEAFEVQTLLLVARGAHQSLHLAPELLVLAHLRELGKCVGLWDRRRPGLLEAVPVNASEEGMRLHFLRSVGAQAVHEVSVEQLANQVLGFGSDHARFVADLRPLDPVASDVVQHFLNGFGPERPHSN